MSRFTYAFSLPTCGTDGKPIGTEGQMDSLMMQCSSALINAKESHVRPAVLTEKPIA